MRRRPDTEARLGGHDGATTHRVAVGHHRRTNPSELSTVSQALTRTVPRRDHGGKACPEARDPHCPAVISGPSAL